MKVLFHKATDHLGTHMDVEFLDGNGKLWTIPWGEPTEFENAFMADKILEHQRYMGLVEVKFNKSRTGITYDMVDAEKRALSTLVEEEKLCINDYIRTQLETRVRANFPPLPPVGRAMSCVIKHRTNLLRFGIRPVGWEPPYEMEESAFNITASQAPGMQSGTGVAGTGVEDRIRQLEQLVMRQQNLIDSMVKVRGVSGGGKKAVNVPPATAPEILAADTLPSPQPDNSAYDTGEDTIDSINL